MSVSSTTSTAVNNIYSSIAAKNKGLGGLVSGLDTESLVESLTLSTRTKISKQQQNRQLLTWKQSAYRTSASALSEFRDKYFYSSNYADRMTQRGWYNIYKATSSSDAIKANASSSAMPGTIEIEQVLNKATYATAKSGKVDSRLLSKSNTDFLAQSYDGKTLELYLGNNLNKVYEIDLSSLDDVIADSYPNVDYPDVQTAFEKELEKLIADKVGYKDNAQTDPVIKVDIDWATKTLELDTALNKITISDNIDELGLSGGFSNRISTSSKVSELFPNLTGAGYKGEDIIFQINGATISAKTSESLSTIITRINNTTGANVKMSYDDVSQTFSIVSNEPGNQVNLTIGDVQGNFLNQIFGTAGGASLVTESSKDNTMNYNLSAATSSIPFTNASQLEGILNTLKGTEAKIKITIDGVTQTLTIGGAGMDLDTIWDSVDAAIRNKILANDAAKADIDDYMADNSRSGAAVSAALSTIMNDWLEENYGVGATYASLPQDDKDRYDLYESTTGTSLARTQARNDYIDATYRADFISGSTNSVIGAVIDPDGPDYHMQLLGIQLANVVSTAIEDAFGKYTAGLVYNTSTHTFSFGVDNKDMHLVLDYDSGTNLFTQLGFGSVPITNYDPTTATTLEDLGVETAGGTLTIGNPPSATIPYDKDTTLHQLKQLLEAEDITLTVVDGVITMTADDGNLAISDSAGDKGILNQIFGVQPDDSNNYKYETTAATETWDNLYTAGINARIVVDGEVMVSQSNDFQINGVTFTVTDTYNLSGTEDPITITVEVDASDLIEKLQEWVDDYNAMYSLLNGYVTEKVATDDQGKATYLPLTDEQKAEMTEKEIEAWEEKAKQGILRNDPTLRRICDQLRATIYKTVESVGLAPYQVGITTSSLYMQASESVDMSKSGLLMLDEEKLKTALETNGEAVISMFTDAQEGLAVKMDAIIDAATNTSSATGQNGTEIKRGTLILLAGQDKITGDNTSTIGNRIDAIDKQISRLKLRLEMEYNRYWKQFSSLETAIARMSAQTSWLSEQY